MCTCTRIYVHVSSGKCECTNVCISLWGRRMCAHMQGHILPRSADMHASRMFIGMCIHVRCVLHWVHTCVPPIAVPSAPFRGALCAGFLAITPSPEFWTWALSLPSFPLPVGFCCQCSCPQACALFSSITQVLAEGSQLLRGFREMEVCVVPCGGCFWSLPRTPDSLSAAVAGALGWPHCAGLSGSLEAVGVIGYCLETQGFCRGHGWRGSGASLARQSYLSPLLSSHF